MKAEGTPPSSCASPTAVPAHALPQRVSRKRSRVCRDVQKPEYSFEYLDHTADIQIHSWGRTLGEAFEHAGHAMYNYMVPLDCIDVNPRVPELRVRASGHDEQSLLYNFLQELLFDFHTEFRVCCVLSVVSLDLDTFTLECVGRGDIFDRNVHACGTEIKAITYSAMHIRHGETCPPEEEDIAPAAGAAAGGARLTNDGNGDATAGDAAEEEDRIEAGRTGHGADVYVIVDI